MEEIVVVITAGSEDEATRISRMLVEKKLAACVNIVPGVRSIFQWEGRIVEEQEFLLLAKTVSTNFDQLSVAVKSHHSYSIPEVIALSISFGSEEYLKWIQRIVKSGKSYSGVEEKKVLNK